MESTNEIIDLALALYISKEDLEEIFRPSNINKKVNIWGNHCVQNVPPEGLTVLEVVLGNYLWNYVALVLKHGADVNIQSDNFLHEAPLHFAMHNYQWDTMLLLVKHGASLTTECRQSQFTAIACYFKTASNYNTQIVKLLMPPRPAAVATPTEIYIAILYLLQNTSDNEDRFDILRYLLLYLPPLTLDYICFTSYGAIEINENETIVGLPDLNGDQPLHLYIEMIFHLFQETCLSVRLSVEMEEECDLLDDDAVLDMMEILSDRMTNHPPSLYKLAALTVKQNMTRCDPSDFETLGLPVCVVSRLKWEELGTDLHAMWHRYQVASQDIWSNSDSD